MTRIMTRPAESDKIFEFIIPGTHRSPVVNAPLILSVMDDKTFPAAAVSASVTVSSENRFSFFEPIGMPQYFFIIKIHKHNLYLSFFRVRTKAYTLRLLLSDLLNP